MKIQLAVLFSAMTFQACAGITIDATRVVYSGKDKAATLNIHNRSRTPYKVQIWLDAGLNRSRVGLPMVATPPLVYLSPSKPPSCALSISAAGSLPIGKACTGSIFRRIRRRQTVTIRCSLSSAPA